MRTLGSLLTVLSILSAGCGETLQSSVAKRGPAPSRIGRFSGESCFLNKLATDAIGQDVYTEATIRFDEGGSGANTYTLYFDEACLVPVLSGETTFTYEEVRTVGEISVLRMEQLNDPSDPGSLMVLWYLAVLTEAGYTLDVEYAHGASGPYLGEPSDGEIAAFAAAPFERGVFFRRVLAGE